MWVESELNKGSTFHFTISTRRTTNDAAELPKNIHQLKGKRALIIDDHTTNRLMMSQQLESWGMFVDAFSSGKETLDLLPENITYDVILIDENMPEVDGKEVAAALIKSPSHASTPRIKLSMLGKQIKKGKEKFWDASINKPVKQLQLAKVILYLLNVEAKSSETSAGNLLDETFAQQYPLQILVAEDNLVNQKVILRILGRLGYRADIVGNGLEVLDAFARRSYDVILMDLHMPEMDGVEATKTILSQFDEDEQPVIVAMTAAVMEEDRQRCRDAGMKAFVSKPVKVDNLVATLKTIQPRSVEEPAEQWEDVNPAV